MKILGVPLYYVHNVGKDLLPILQESIECIGRLDGKRFHSNLIIP